MEQVLLELIELVKTAAPELWRIALRQVWALNIQVLVSLVIVAVVTFLAVRASMKWASEMRDEYNAYVDEYDRESSWSRSGPDSLSEWMTDQVDPLLTAFAIVGGLILTVVIVVVVVNSLGSLPRFINPEYYAIQHLMDLVK